MEIAPSPSRSASTHACVTIDCLFASWRAARRSGFRATGGMLTVASPPWRSDAAVAPLPPPGCRVFRSVIEYLS